MKITIRNLIASLLIFFVGYLALETIKLSKKRKEVVTENAELKNIKYGLLSVHVWKRQISDIIAKKVKDFEITAENRDDFRESIQNVMYEILDEVAIILDAKKNQGGFFEQMFAELFQSLVFDINDIKDRVPEFTEAILNELNNYETREKLRLMVQKKINELLQETIGEEDLSAVEAIIQKNGCETMQRCSDALQMKLLILDDELSLLGWIMLGLSCVTFVLILVGNSSKNILDYTVLVILLGILLLISVMTPIIDIDARIDNFKFLLMGEPLEFSNQILFFQSKGILEVVEILFATKENQAKLVGGMIVLFSIIFPITKLIASLALISKPQLYSNKLVHFLALKSGKWSMADVLVVAIFMAYIGFSGIIENQLSYIENISSRVEILTTDNSSFGVGFILFLSFCIGSLVISSAIEKSIPRLETENN